METDPETQMLSYIWNTWGRLPSEIYNLPSSEKALVYYSTKLRIEAENKAAAKAAKG